MHQCATVKAMTYTWFGILILPRKFLDPLYAYCTYAIRGIMTNTPNNTHPPSVTLCTMETSLTTNEYPCFGIVVLFTHTIIQGYAFQG